MADVEMIIEDSDLSFLADDSASDFSFEDENVAPKSKAKAGKGNRKATGKAKGKGKAKAKGAALTSSSSANANAADSASAPTAGPSKKKTIEERYQKKTQLEHILLRPDTYIGSTERVTQRMIVLGSGSHSDSDSDSVSDPSPDSNSAPAPAKSTRIHQTCALSRYTGPASFLSPSFPYMPSPKTRACLCRSMASSTA